MTLLTPLVDLITGLIGLFDSKEVAVLVVLAMLGLFAGTTAWIWMQHRRHMASLKSATKALRDALMRTDWTSADRLNAADAVLTTNPVVGVAWSQYRASLREDSSKPGSYVNFVQPSGWFADSRLPGSSYEKWIATFANVFLCIGLLFTFVGLSAALLGVGSTQTAEEVQLAVNRILNVSSAKFITSIMGIVLYIALLVYSRWVSNGRQKAVRLFADGVRKLTSMVTPETVLMDQLVASREQSEILELRMKRLADDIAVAFEARLGSAIKEMGSTIGQGTQEALKHVAVRLETAASTMGSTLKGIGSTGAEFGSQINDAAATITTAAESITKTMAQLETRINGIDDALARGSNSISNVSSLLGEATSKTLEESLKAINDEAVRSAKTAREQSEAALMPLMAALQQLAGQIKKQAEESRGQLVEGSETAAGTLKAAAHQMSEVLASTVWDASTKLKAAADIIAERMQAAVVQFQALELAVAKHVDHLDQTGTAITKAGVNFGSAATQLRHAAEPIQAILVNVDTAARNVSQALETTDRVQAGVLDAMAKMQESITGAMTRLQDAASATSLAIKSYEDRFAATDEALGRTVEKLVNGTTSLGEAAETTIQGMNIKLSEALGSLRTGTELIRENIVGLEDASLKIADAIREWAAAIDRSGKRP